MSICADYQELASAREGLYGFLARVYRTEVTEKFLADVRGLAFPASSSTDDFSEGVACLRAFLEKPGIDPRTELAVDYARVFLGAGIADGSSAYPYESVYTSPERLMMQDARDKVLALYAAHGLGVEGESHDPEDHAAFELDFMMRLVGEGAAAAAAGDEDALAASLEDQRAFLRDHLMNWMGRFCADVERYASTEFYRAIAKMTAGFLAMDAALLDDLVVEGGADS